MFSVNEQDFVRGMKRKDRGDLGKLLMHPSRAKPVPLRIKVLQSNLPDSLKTQLFHDLSHPIADKYLQWCLKMLRMPIGVYHRSIVTSDVPRTLREAKRSMDDIIVGQEVAKREVMKLLHQSLDNPREAPTAYALGLEGKPGCGKTQFVRRAMVTALNRPVISIPLGGTSDGASFLWGHSYSYEGSKEGRLAGGLMEVGCCNPIIHFDEVDKVVERERGGSEIIASLIHLIDPSANTSLRDRYLHGLDIDFSKCIFVFSYNDPEKINPVLLNRIKRIGFDTPTHVQKKEIVQTQLIPRIQARLHTTVTFEDSTLDWMLTVNEGDSGLRDLEKSIDHVLSCAGLSKVLDGTSSDVIDLSFARECMVDLVRHETTTAPPPNMYS